MQSGQESAPFELLVTVIIMSFVIFVGLHALQELSKTQCFTKVDAGLEKLKTSIEAAVAQKAPKRVFFRLSTCFNPDDEQVLIRNWNSPTWCASECGTAELTCTTLEYRNTAVGKQYSDRRCLNIAPETAFPVVYTGKCVNMNIPGEREFELQNFKETIPQGNYLLINKTRATDLFPTICAYREV